MDEGASVGDLLGNLERIYDGNKDGSKVGDLLGKKLG